MTAAIRDLKLLLGSGVEIAVHTSAPDIWLYNPHIVDVGKGIGFQSLRLDYGKDYNGQRKDPTHNYHFLTAFHKDIKRKLGFDVPVLYPKPDIHLGGDEHVRPIDRRYWVVLSGGKSDVTIKPWVTTRLQQAVDYLRQQGLNFVQVGALEKPVETKKTRHFHPPLSGALNLLHKTNLRDLIRLIHHSDGVICGVTMAMHLAAALEKPCVVFAGGRESWWWEAYTNEGEQFGPQASGKLKVPHRYLHTIGLLPCCQQAGCLRNQVKALKPKDYACERPVAVDGQLVAECMRMIQVEHVVEAVMSYYKDGTLPPISPNPAPLAALPTTTTELPVLTVELAGRADLSGPAGAQVQIPTAASRSLLDLPEVGGKFTIFVLFYGPTEMHEMHRTCLESILDTVPKERRELRVGSNMLCQQSLEMIEQYQRSGDITAHYRHETNDFKYPVMREMFHDPERPITTKWCLWFDDDSFCNVNREWLTLLAGVMAASPPNVGMVGTPQYSSLNGDQQRWVKDASWYRGKPFRSARGISDPSGNKTFFCTGSFWAIKTEVIQAADVPDCRILHNGGDVMIGEQVWQAGYSLQSWNSRKQYVKWSAVPRRGESQPAAGTARYRELYARLRS